MTIESVALWLGLLGYVAAGVCAVVALILERDGARLVGPALALGLALHTLSLAARWARLGHGPFVSMFEILSSNVWSLTLAFALAWWRIRAIRPVAAFVMPVIFLMMGWLLVSSPVDGHFPPTYRTLWLYVHIGFGKVFLGAVLVSVGLSAAILARASGVGRRRLAGLPADERLDDLSFRFMGIGLVFESLMLVSGAIWAQDAWGRYWSWDPLETWALLTWLALAFALHVRVAVRVPPPVGAMLVIGVFAVAFLTFFGVPFVSTSPHKGAV